MTRSLVVYVADLILVALFAYWVGSAVLSLWQGDQEGVRDALLWAIFCRVSIRAR
jgi:hypothetical protein